MKKFASIRLLLALIAVSAFNLSAAIIVTVTFDENGNGFYSMNGVNTPLVGVLAPDPGPGGLGSVLTYSHLPVPGVVGDLELTDAGVPGDVLRWNGNNTIAVYSDTPPTDAEGDTPSPPASFYTNIFAIPEIGPEGANGATWVPSAGNPGFGNSDFTITYNFVSDGTIPEPGTLALIPLGLASFGLLWIRRRRCC